MRPKTYRESLVLVHPLILRWKRPHVQGGSVKTLPCPACGAPFTMSKAAGTGLLRGICTTAFCVNFSEA